MNASTQMAVLPETTGVTRKPRVLVAGEFSAGKSRLINGLIGKDVLPSNVTSTALPPIWLVYGNSEPFIVDLDGEITDFNVNEIEVHKTAFCVLSTECEILRHLDLIDTPGNSDPNIPPICWERMVQYADGLVWCTSAMQAWKQTEKATCADLPESLLENATVMITQADRMPDERSAQKVQRRVARDAGKYFSDVIMGSMLFDEDVAQIRDHVIEMAQGLNLRGMEEDIVDQARSEPSDEPDFLTEDEDTPVAVAEIESYKDDLTAVDSLAAKDEDTFDFKEEPKAAKANKPTPTTDDEVLAAVLAANAPKPRRKSKRPEPKTNIEDAFAEVQAELGVTDQPADEAEDVKSLTDLDKADFEDASDEVAEPAVAEVEAEGSFESEVDVEADVSDDEDAAAGVLEALMAEAAATEDEADKEPEAAAPVDAEVADVAEDNLVAKEAPEVAAEETEEPVEAAAEEAVAEDFTAEASTDDDQTAEDTAEAIAEEASEDDDEEEDAWSDWGVDEDDLAAEAEDVAEAAAESDVEKAPETSLGMPNGMVADLWAKMSVDTDLSDNEKHMMAIAGLLKEVQSILQSGAEDAAPSDDKG